MIVEPASGAAAPAEPGVHLHFAPERVQDAARIDGLIGRAFGPGRFAKTAERLREGSVQRLDLSPCAWLDDALVGAVRLWPAAIGARPVLFLGPIAVERAFRRRGLGAELVEHACAWSRAAGEAAVVLVGDLGFFGPLGFEPVPPGQVVLPGPVDPGRVFWIGLGPGALEPLSGPLTPRR